MTDHTEEQNEGYIAIGRGLFKHMLWEEDREYSKAEAWLDLIQTAWYGEVPARRLFNNRPIMWKRGQVAASIRFLQERWGWSSTSRVSNFLDFLINEEMIELNKEQGQNIITLCKYDEYNPLKKDKRTATERSENSNRTLGERSENEREEIKETNTTNLPIEMAPADAVPPARKSLEDRKEEFRGKVMAYVDRYGEEMCMAFFTYWCQVNDGGQKMLWEKERDKKSFEINYRLGNWKRMENERRGGKVTQQPSTGGADDAKVQQEIRSNAKAIKLDE